jgi:hypothetical protein
MKFIHVAGSVMLALCVVGAAYAHHSAAGIDQTKSVTQEGIVKTFKWANPHSWLEIEVQNSKGQTEIWNLEMQPPSFLVRAGWKSTSVKPGDKIKFSARPFKNGDPGGLFVSVTLPDGKVLTQRAAAPAAGATPPASEQK